MTHKVSMECCLTIIRLKWSTTLSGHTWFNYYTLWAWLSRVWETGAAKYTLIQPTVEFVLLIFVFQVARVDTCWAIWMSGTAILVCTSNMHTTHLSPPPFFSLTMHSPLWLVDYVHYLWIMDCGLQKRLERNLLVTDWMCTVPHTLPLSIFGFAASGRTCLTCVRAAFVVRPLQ